MLLSSLLFLMARTTTCSTHIQLSRERALISYACCQERSSSTNTFVLAAGKKIASQHISFKQWQPFALDPLSLKLSVTPRDNKKLTCIYSRLQCTLCVCTSDVVENTVVSALDTQPLSKRVWKRVVQESSGRNHGLNTVLRQKCVQRDWSFLSNESEQRPKALTPASVSNPLLARDTKPCMCSSCAVACKEISGD